MEKKDIKDLVKFLDQTGISKFQLKDGDFELLVEKNISSSNVEVIQSVQPQVAPVQQVATPTQQETKEENGNFEFINSPMVGTFYKAPSPGAEAFVKVGDVVSKGQTLCIIEAMKIMNEIEAEFDCKIVEILVNDAEPVEYDTPLFKVERV